MQKTVVLTFDDSCINHGRDVVPVLEKYGFGGTFFIAYPKHWYSNTADYYMDWEDMAEIDRKGFEIGNHTMNHPDMRVLSDEDCRREVETLNDLFREHGITKPVSFAYPGGPYAGNAVKVLQEAGFKYSRTTEHGLWEFGKTDLMRLPSFAITDFNLENFQKAIDMLPADENTAAILLYHGVPDIKHPRCTTKWETFMEHMDYLKENNYRVLSMRDFGALAEKN